MKTTVMNLYGKLISDCFCGHDFCLAQIHILKKVIEPVHHEASFSSIMHFRQWCLRKFVPYNHRNFIKLSMECKVIS